MALVLLIDAPLLEPQTNVDEWVSESVAKPLATGQEWLGSGLHLWFSSQSSLRT